MKTLLILLVPLSVLIAGCSDDKSATVEEDASFSGMVESQERAMQKAKALEGVLLDADKKRREESGQ
ncbi:MAG: hypothetical protein HKM22_04885 [Gammaproteobacteria bacterium]|nr:hypothetical protein [Gammaproteobacteria bacterium]